LPRFRGNAAFIQSIRESCEFILSGPYETGKTFAALWLLDSLLREFPGSRAAILRKIRATMDSTVLETWRAVIEIRGGVEVYGGNKPLWYDYANGSRVYIGGLDDPGKSLSGERDFIYGNQCEEFDKEDWETLSTRATGRSAKAFDENGVPIAILFGDCNPGPPNHWILKRTRLQLLPTFHKDNPTLYTDDGNLTPRGKQTTEILDALTGVQKDRGKDGKWVAGEGLVYSDEWNGTPDDPTGNISKEAEYNPDLDVYWGVDNGYSGKEDEQGDFTPDSHPLVILFYHLLSNGDIHIFDELYRIKLQPEEVIQEALDTKPYPKPRQAIVDKSAAALKDRLYEDFHIYYINSKDTVEEGIKKARSYIKADKNGHRRLKVNPRCVHLTTEFVSYIYGKDGKPKKANDHGPDVVRYVCVEHG